MVREGKVEKGGRMTRTIIFAAVSAESYEPVKSLFDHFETL